MGIVKARSREEQAAIERLQEAEGMSEEEILREKLSCHLKEKGITQSGVAKAIDVSASMVSMFLAGTYPNPEKIIPKIKSYFQSREKAADAVQLPELAETSVYKEVQAVLDYVHSQRDIGVIYGPAGIGKTTALRAFQEVTPLTVYITANQTTSGSKALLEEILYQLGRPESGTPRRMMRTIVEVLRDSGRMVIIDEAQHLSYRALETLRALYDQCNIGLILAGNESIYGNMTGRASAPFAQLYSRVGIRRPLSGRITLPDVKELLGGEVEKDSLAFLHRVALEPGGLRVVGKLYKLAKVAANNHGERLSIEYLRAAQDFMMQSRVAG